MKSSIYLYLGDLLFFWKKSENTINSIQVYQQNEETNKSIILKTQEIKRLSILQRSETIDKVTKKSIVL